VTIAIKSYDRILAMMSWKAVSNLKSLCGQGIAYIMSRLQKQQNSKQIQQTYRCSW